MLALAPVVCDITVLFNLSSQDAIEGSSCLKQTVVVAFKANIGAQRVCELAQLFVVGSYFKILVVDSELISSIVVGCPEHHGC